MVKNFGVGIVEDALYDKISSLELVLHCMIMTRKTTE